MAGALEAAALVVADVEVVGLAEEVMVAGATVVVVMAAAAQDWGSVGAALEGVVAAVRTAPSHPQTTGCDQCTRQAQNM